jgi:hypothetical protein
MSLILDGSTGISGSAGVIDAETFAGQANTYYTDISARLGYTPLSNVNPSYSGTLTGNTGIINIGSGQFYKDANGQVGIGTTSPSYRLSVKQSANTSSASLGVVSINSANDTFIGIGYDSASDTNRVLSSYISTGAFKPISFWTSDSQRMQIDISGNVGIGTISPTGKLHVAGAMPSITGGNGQLQVFSTDTIAADKGGKIALGGVSGEGGSFDPYGFCYVAGLKENATASNFAGYLSFGTSNSGGSVSEKMRIDSSGNVGIGTTSPVYQLHTVGNTNGNISNAVTNSAAGASAVSRFIALSNAGNATFGMTSSTFTDITGAQDAMLLNANNASGGIAFALDGVVRMKLDSSGNVGIGTVSPTSKIYVTTASSTLYGLISQTPVVGLTAGDYVNMAYFADSRSGSNDGLRIVNVRDSTGSGVGDWGTSSYRIRRSVDQSDAATGVQEEIVFGTNLLAFNTGGSERMRLDSSGNLLVGTTSTNPVASRVNGSGLLAGGGLRVRCSSGVSYFGIDSTSGTNLNFYTDNGSAFVGAGTISSSGSTTTYATSSDYRLKENVQPMSGALDTVLALKPVTYTWKPEFAGTSPNGQGFIAHELQEVVPDCVTGTKDAIDKDGKPQHQGVDTSFLVATLTAAIQELKSIIDQQDARIKTLEGKV